MESEIDSIQIDTSERANKDYREPDVVQACGGVRIIVQIGVRHGKLADIPNVGLPLNELHAFIPRRLQKQKKCALRCLRAKVLSVFSKVKKSATSEADV